MLPIGQGFGVVAIGLGVAAVTAGLLSSTLHLGHPERAWRAFSQWRSSWLSREGIVAILTYGPILLLARCWVFAGPDSNTLKLWAVLTVIGSIATIYCTAMIYRSLATIHQWHNRWTVPNYLVLGLAGGAVWLHALLMFFGIETTISGAVAIVLLIGGWLAKTGYWRFIDSSAHVSSPESATGLGRFGRVSLLEAPHSEENYLLKEMGYRVARAHAAKLRRYAAALAFALPILLIGAAFWTDGVFGILAGGIAAVSLTLGLVIERWLFFAEAKHVVTLYYGATSA
jgi:DMSO reductase anchor subunit